ncbi:MAG: 50S ribosomal protein L20 [Candidatus Hodgkinia cicadicola]
MSRVSRGVVARARHKQILSLAKGYYGRRKSTIKVAKQAVVRAMFNRYKSRRLKRRDLKSRGVKLLGRFANKYRLSYKLTVFGFRRLQLSLSLPSVLALARLGIAGDSLFSLMVLA